jgi:hypothetical protein
MSVVCVCGTVADDGDVECSLCGRDLASLRSGAASHGPSSSPTHQTDALWRPGGSAPANSPHDHKYADPPASRDQAMLPAYGWDPPRTKPAPMPEGPAGTYRGGTVAVIVIAALAVVIAGLALGYFVVASFLT